MATKSFQQRTKIFTSTNSMLEMYQSELKLAQAAPLPDDDEL